MLYFKTSNAAPGNAAAKLPRVLATAAVTGMVAMNSGAFVTPAMAVPNAKIKEMTISTKSAYNQVVRVVSTDYKKWDKIEPGTALFWAQMKIDTKWPGLINKVGVFLGKCNGYGCTSYSQIYNEIVDERDYLKSRNFSFDTAALMYAQIDNSAIQNWGQYIINRCNTGLSADGPTEKQIFYQDVQVTLGADTVQLLHKNTNKIEFGPLYNSKHVAHGTFTVKVICDPVDPPPETAEVKLPTKMTDLKLFLSTFSHAETNPSIGIKCKKGQILLRAKTNQEGPVKLRLWSKVGNQPMQSEVFDAWSQPTGSGEYKAEIKKWVSVSKDSLLQARVEDLLTKPVGFHDGWKDLMLKCGSSGADGYAQQPADDPNVVKKEISGKLNLAELKNTPKSKPRDVKVVYQLHSNVGQPVAYKLICSGGREWTGTRNLKKKKFTGAKHKYRAIGAHTFKVNETETVGCSLLTTSLSKKALLALANRTFAVSDGLPTAGKPDTLADQQRPDPSAGKPKKKKKTKHLSKKKPAGRHVKKKIGKPKNVLKIRVPKKRHHDLKRAPKKRNQALKRLMQKSPAVKMKKKQAKSRKPARRTVKR